MKKKTKRILSATASFLMLFASMIMLLSIFRW